MTTLAQIIVTQMGVLFQAGEPAVMTFDVNVVDSNGITYQRTYHHTIAGADQTAISNFMIHIITEIQNATGTPTVLN